MPRLSVSRRRQTKGFLCLVVLALLFIAGSLIMLEGRLRPGIKEAAEIKAKQAAVIAMNQAVRETISSKLIYSDLVIIHKDSQGRVVMMQPNTIKINQLVADTTLSVQDSLLNLSHGSFSFPVGEAFNSPLFSSYGPDIYFRIKPIGNIRTKVLDNFQTAGINQTRHSIYLQIESQMAVITPVFTTDIEMSTTVPLAETIIVGEVPKAFLQFGNVMDNRSVGYDS